MLCVNDVRNKMNDNVVRVAVKKHSIYNIVDREFSYLKSIIKTPYPVSTNIQEINACSRKLMQLLADKTTYIDCAVKSAKILNYTSIKNIVNIKLLRKLGFDHKASDLIFYSTETHRGRVIHIFKKSNRVGVGHQRIITYSVKRSIWYIYEISNRVSAIICKIRGGYREIKLSFLQNLEEINYYNYNYEKYGRHYYLNDGNISKIISYSRNTIHGLCEFFDNNERVAICYYQYGNFIHCIFS